jgi:hypothetical protein
MKRYCLFFISFLFLLITSENINVFACGPPNVSVNINSFLYSCPGPTHKDAAWTASIKATPTGGDLATKVEVSASDRPYTTPESETDTIHNTWKTTYGFVYGPFKHDYTFIGVIFFNTASYNKEGGTDNDQTSATITGDGPIEWPF